LATIKKLLNSNSTYGKKYLRQLRMASFYRVTNLPLDGKPKIPDKKGKVNENKNPGIF
jgi:hypothetical protein